jgi:hypothetical protein
MVDTEKDFGGGDMSGLNIGDLVHNLEDVMRKVEADIAFLTERLQLLEQQYKPNAVIRQTYSNMLESRYAVLQWLHQEALQVKPSNLNTGHNFTPGPNPSSLSPNLSTQVQNPMV